MAHIMICYPEDMSVNESSHNWGRLHVERTRLCFACDSQETKEPGSLPHGLTLELTNKETRCLCRLDHGRACDFAP